jgi:hypothetical protein
LLCLLTDLYNNIPLLPSSMVVKNELYHTSVTYTIHSAVLDYRKVQNPSQVYSCSSHFLPTIHSFISEPDFS